MSTNKTNVKKNSNDKYHHGNLKKELIEQGLRIINEEGEESLSFRKVAAACGVSHTAAYAHFSNKEDMINSIKETVADEFTNELEEAVKKVKSNSYDKKIIAMGRRYVSFFIERPDYYKFLFEKQMIAVHFDANNDYENDFKAFRLLKKLYLNMIEESGIKKAKAQKEKELIQIWSSVHGLASIACMKNAVYDGSWEKLIKELVN